MKTLIPIIAGLLVVGCGKDEQSSNINKSNSLSSKHVKELPLKEQDNTKQLQLKVIEPPASVEAIKVPNNGIQPFAMLDEAGTVHMIYYKGTDLYYVTRKNSMWSPAKQVSGRTQKGTIMGPISTPKLAIGKNGRIHISWFRFGRRKSQFYYARMADDQATFEKTVQFVRQNAVGTETPATVVADSKGNVALIWHAGNFQEVEKRGVFMRFSKDEGKTFAAEMRISDEQAGACPCCSLTAAFDSDGNLYTFFRGAEKKVKRGMILSKSTNQGKSFISSAVDQWNLNSCPVSTNAMAQDANGKVWMAWESRNKIYFAKTDKPTPSYQVPASEIRQRSPSIALNSKGEILVAWAEGPMMGAGKLRWQLYNAQCKPINAKAPLPAKVSRSTAPVVLTNSQNNFVVFY
jgi:hypothetical protein